MKVWISTAYNKAYMCVWSEKPKNSWYRYDGSGGGEYEKVVVCRSLLTSLLRDAVIKVPNHGSKTVVTAEVTFSKRIEIR